MPRVDPDVEQEIQEERAEYIDGFEPDPDATVSLAEDWGFRFEVRFDKSELRTLFAAMNDEEGTSEFIREATLATARQRLAERGTEAAS